MFEDNACAGLSKYGRKNSCILSAFVLCTLWAFSLESTSIHASGILCHLQDVTSFDKIAVRMGQKDKSKIYV